MTTIDTKHLRELAEKRYDLLDADGDIQGRDRESIILILLDEIERLRQWKAEAMQVHAEWEETWIAAGRPGRPGTSKAAGVRELMDEQMRDDDGSEDQ